MTKEKLLDLIVLWENMELLIPEMVNNHEHLPVLMDLALYSSHPKSWRAAWIADKIHDNNPELFVPYLEKIIIRLKKESSGSKKRQFLKLLSLHPLPEKHHSFLLEYCISCFTSAKEPISVRVYSLQVLYNISEIEPEFKPELFYLIEHEINYHPTPGILSRGKKLAMKLMKQISASSPTPL